MIKLDNGRGNQLIDSINFDAELHTQIGQICMFDTTDRKLLAALDKDTRAPIALLSQMLGMARGTVQNRLERLARSKSLRPNSTRIRPAALGFPLRAVVTATMRQTELKRTIAALRNVSCVVECLAVSGSDDVLCQIVARDTDHLYEIGQAILLVPGIERTSTSVVLKEHIEYRLGQLMGDLEPGGSRITPATATYAENRPTDFV